MNTTCNCALGSANQLDLVSWCNRFTVRNTLLGRNTSKDSCHPVFPYCCSQAWQPLPWAALMCPFSNEEIILSASHPGNENIALRDRQREDRERKKDVFLVHWLSPIWRLAKHKETAKSRKRHWDLEEKEGFTLVGFAGFFFSGSM